jgi:hypothetical protein
MAGAPDFTHAAFAQLLLQVIAPQLAGGRDGSAEPVDHARTHVGEPHRDDRADRRVEVVGPIHADLTPRAQQVEREQRHPRGGEGGGEHGPGRRGEDEGKENDHRGRPGQVGQDADVPVVLPEGAEGDDEADRHLVQQSEDVEPGGGNAAEAGDPPDSEGGDDDANVGPVERRITEEIAGGAVPVERSDRPSSEEEEGVDREGDQHQEREEAQAAADLLEEVRREGGGDPQTVLRAHVGLQQGDALVHGELLGHAGAGHRPAGPSAACAG